MLGFNASGHWNLANLLSAATRNVREVTKPEAKLAPVQENVDCRLLTRRGRLAHLTK